MHSLYCLFHYIYLLHYQLLHFVLQYLRETFRTSVTKLNLDRPHFSFPNRPHFFTGVQAILMQIHKADTFLQNVPRTPDTKLVNCLPSSPSLLIQGCHQVIPRSSLVLLILGWFCTTIALFVSHNSIDTCQAISFS